MKKKILLVDDDTDFVAINRDFLISNGFQVLVAYNGQEAEQVLAEEIPDLMILDVMMSEVGEGFEVARNVRADERTAHIPILMLTSVNQEHDFNLTIGPDANWNPVDQFVEKPIEHKQLLEKVYELLKIEKE